VKKECFLGGLAVAAPEASTRANTESFLADTAARSWGVLRGGIRQLRSDYYAITPDSSEVKKKPHRPATAAGLWDFCF